MKKTLKFFVMAFAALAFMGCPPQQPGNEYTKLTFKESTVQLGEGESTKLVVLYEPATLDAPVCEWASSDTTVVAVDQNGTIYGIAAGSANVTAKVGELEAVCQVEVLDPMQLIEWGGFTLWGLDRSTILSPDTVKKTLSTGQEVSCVMVPATWTIWDTNLFFSTNTLVGTGYTMLSVPGTVLLITDSIDKEGPNYYYLGMNSLRVVPAEEFNPTDTAFVNCVLAGTITGTAAEHFAYLTDTTETVAPVVDGAVIDVIDFNSGKYVSPYAGLAKEGIFVGDENSVEYKFNVSWFDYYSAYGLTLVETPEGYDFKQPYEWAPLHDYYYEFILPEEEAAPKYVAKEFVAPTLDIKQLKRTKNPTNVMIKK